MSATPSNNVASWSSRYGARHRLVRVAEFPAGVAAPRKVRVYYRHDHYVLQWWDPQAKANLSDRVDGDLVAAIVRARQLEERLTASQRGGVGVRRLGHADLVSRFLADLARRAEAGAVAPATLGRYRSALAHYLAYCGQVEVEKSYPHAAGVNRDFRLGFAAFLAARSVPPNGHPNAAPRPLKGAAFILDAARAMLEWAADPDRGALLPDGFRNPFLRVAEKRPLLEGDPLAEPDVTLAMALDFVGACDLYQLRLFVPLLLFGLRASEPCLLFLEYQDGPWLRVPCNADLDYRTKGRRDKRFPLADDLAPFWDLLRGGRGQGLLYERRAVAEGREEAAWRGASLEALVREFRRRCDSGGALTAAKRAGVRGRLLHEAGGLKYDHVEAEFSALARRLGWPRQATLKDFRHLFCTLMASAALPEAYRRYLMGHAPDRAAITAYTHLHDLRRQYADALRRGWGPLVAAIRQRATALKGG